MLVGNGPVELELFYLGWSAIQYVGARGRNGEVRDRSS